MCVILAGLLEVIFSDKGLSQYLKKKKIPLHTHKQSQELICNLTAFIGDVIGNFRITV